MNCNQANQIDLVEYLNLLGHQPCKVNNHNYWYISPLREEKKASFKVNKKKNIWYDHGLGKGGTLVDFSTEYYRCDISKALEKISFFHPQNHFQNIASRRSFHSLGNDSINEAETRETAIKIIAAKQPIEDSSLCSYLKKRRINFDLASKHCHEVIFMLNNKERNYRAIGFKSNAGGYELRNEYFRASSSPKYISCMDNKAKI